MLGLREGVKPNPNIVRILNTSDIYGPPLRDIKWRGRGRYALKNSRQFPWHSVSFHAPPPPPPPMEYLDPPQYYPDIMYGLFVKMLIKSDWDSINDLKLIKYVFCSRK